MLFAATIIELSASGERATIWSGGMPDGLIIGANGGIKKRIKSKHMPLAAMENYEFSQDIEVYNLKAGERIYLYTDGVTESVNARGEMFSEVRLESIFSEDSDDYFETILERLREFTGDEQEDDTTLVELTCTELSDNVRNEVIQELSDERENAIPWSINIALDAKTIKSTDPVPQVVNLMMNATGICVHQDFISTILSELYNNALDHGVLGLSSIDKDSDDGFVEYYEKRMDAINTLDNARITINVRFDPTVLHGAVVVRITDSGKGFDYEALNKEMDDEGTHGRGYLILRELCDSITYSDGGRTVEAVYLLESNGF